MKTIYCIRHGMSQHNVDYNDEGEAAYMKQSNYDTELVSKGIEQAQLLQTWVSKIPVDYVIVSPLTRAIQTAQHMFANTDHVLHLYDEVIEFPKGVHTPNKRKNVTQLKQLYPTFNYDNMRINEPMWSPIIEETEEELHKRIASFVLYLQSLPYNTIVIVSHSSYLHALLTYNLGPLDYDAYITYCYPYVFELSV